MVFGCLQSGTSAASCKVNCACCFDLCNILNVDLRCQLDSVIYCKNTQTIVCSSAECDLYFVDFKYLRITKQFAGFNDEIYDSCLVSEDLNCLAVVSNSPALRIYNLTSYSCNFVTGT